MAVETHTPQIVNRSVNPRDVAYMFQTYARGIHAKVHKEDPNLLKLSIACARVSLPSPNFTATAADHCSRHIFHI